MRFFILHNDFPILWTWISNTVCYCDPNIKILNFHFHPFTKTKLYQMKYNLVQFLHISNNTCLYQLYFPNLTKFKDYTSIHSNNSNFRTSLVCVSQNHLRILTLHTFSYFKQYPFTQYQILYNCIIFSPYQHFKF